MKEKAELRKSLFDRLHALPLADQVTIIEDIATAFDNRARARNASSVKKIVHDCLECKHPIEIYWYRPKMSISRG